MVYVLQRIPAINIYKYKRHIFVIDRKTPGIITR